jgi:mono/diheme cytochrome c family protein
VPESTLHFPLNLIVRTIPAPANPQPVPPLSDTLAYGEYLVTIASCADCHTPSKEGKPVPGMDFAGGAEFNLPFGLVRSANITPDEETGIGSWDRQEFLDRFKEYADSAASHRPVKQGNFNTIMPWLVYAGMTEDDLGAIYAYLRTQKPVENRVITFTAKP